MKTTFYFLKLLEKNNNREWFVKHKSLYEASQEEMICFADRLLAEVNKTDLIETPSGKKSLYRIYRDVRFGVDKTPYKINWAGGFRRATSERRGGYYFQVGHHGSFVMGGFFSPNATDLLHIRRQISHDPDTLREIVDSPEFQSHFGMLRGTQLKTAPKGFDKEHLAIDLLRYKQFVVRHDFTEAEVHSPDFSAIVAHSFSQMRPFFDYMSEILTTDLNGESI